MTFSTDELVAILGHPSVDAAMRHVVSTRTAGDLPKVPPWEFNGPQLTAPFLLLRACVHRAVWLAVEMAQGREFQRLMLMLRLSEADTTGPAMERTARAVGVAVEEYAVTMQHGPEGVRSYREFVKSNGVGG